jgi:hypothetical protein
MAGIQNIEEIKAVLNPYFTNVYIHRMAQSYLTSVYRALHDNNFGVYVRALRKLVDHVNFVIEEAKKVNDFHENIPKSFWNQILHRKSVKSAKETTENLADIRQFREALSGLVKSAKKLERRKLP